MKFDPKSVLRKDSKTPFKKIGADIMLLNLQDGNYFVLNEAGFFIWKSLDGRKKLASIAVMLAKKFKVKEGEALRDLLFFVKKLRRLKLLAAV